MRELPSRELGQKPILSVFPPVFGLDDPRHGYSEGRFANASHIYSPAQEVELLQTFTAPNYMSLFFYRLLRQTGLPDENWLGPRALGKK